MGEDTETNTYREYLQTLGVNGETHDILVANGFDSKEALSVMEMGDIMTIKIKPLGQRRLLERALKNLASRDNSVENERDGGSRGGSGGGSRGGSGDGSRGGSGGGSSGGPGGSMDGGGGSRGVSSVDNDGYGGSRDGPGGSEQQGRLDRMSTSLDTLLQTTSTAPSVPGTTTSGGYISPVTSHVQRADLNPLVYLSDNKNTEYHDIVDFVPITGDTPQSEQLLSSDGGGDVVLRTGPRKPKLETISQMQWTAANARILAKLLIDGKLASENVAHYLSYTVKIALLSQRFTWQSVLFYDREYRRVQSAYHFPWGSDVQHLVSVHLIPRYETKHTPSREKTSKFSTNATSNTQGICKLFNHSKCTYGDQCRYSHKCNICKGSHPQFEHPR